MCNSCQSFKLHWPLSPKPFNFGYRCFGVFGIVYHKEHPPEVWTVPPFTPCIFFILSRSVLITMRNVSDKSYRENQTHVLCSTTRFKKWASYEITWKNIVEPDHKWQYGACALHAGYLRLHQHTKNMYYLFLYHHNNGYKNAPRCYVIRTVPVFTLYIKAKI